MDEVHYLADRMRGAVWEEVIIHLPESVALVSLSRDGLQRRGVRRVAGDRARRDDHDRRGAAAGAAVPARDGRPADVRPVRPSDVDASAGFVQRGRAGQPRAASGSPATTGRAAAGCATGARRARASRAVEGPAAVGTGRRRGSPSRVDVVERLDREGLLPAIVFIFSRVGCDAAVAAVPRTPTCG